MIQGYVQYRRCMRKRDVRLVVRKLRFDCTRFASMDRSIAVRPFRQLGIRIRLYNRDRYGSRHVELADDILNVHQTPRRYIRLYKRTPHGVDSRHKARSGRTAFLRMRRRTVSALSWPNIYAIPDNPNRSNIRRFGIPTRRLDSRRHLRGIGKLQDCKRRSVRIVRFRTRLVSLGLPSYTLGTGFRRTLRGKHSRSFRARSDKRRFGRMRRTRRIRSRLRTTHTGCPGIREGRRNQRG